MFLGFNIMMAFGLVPFGPHCSVRTAAASCGCHMHCIVIRGDAWLVWLSPCNTFVRSSSFATTGVQHDAWTGALGLSTTN